MSPELTTAWHSTLDIASGIRDDFMNQEALERMQQEQNLSNPLEEIERLVREGKSDEALKKMQELSMKLDEMFENLEEGADAADENADPELSRDFEKFTNDLKETIDEQQKVADQTKRLKDKARQAAKERIRFAVNHYWDMRAGRLPKRAD